MTDRLAAGAGARNLWALSVTSFLVDISSEMVQNLVPLFLAGVLGVRTNVIGLIEGVAEATSSLLKVASGRLSDRLDRRKGLVVAGYAISALAKPLYALAGSWGVVAGARWSDRVGKGIRTAPRDALLAAGAPATRRGWVFGVHRAADTAGAVVGLAIAIALVSWLQGPEVGLRRDVFQIAVLASLVPAVIAVAVVALGVRDLPAAASPASPMPAISRARLGRPFVAFLVIVALFELGDSADAFVILRASERGLSVVGILAMLLSFNLIYAVASAPAGHLSDRFGRRRVLVSGWVVYAGIYLGLGAAEQAWQVWALYVGYGCYHGLTAGAARALVADLVPAERLGAAYGAFHAVVGLMALPASLIAGVLWQGIAGWAGFGAAAPFQFGAVTATVAVVCLLAWRPAPVG